MSCLCSWQHSLPNSCLYEAGLQHLNGHSLGNSCRQQVCFKKHQGWWHWLPICTRYWDLVVLFVNCIYETQETIYNKVVVLGLLYEYIWLNIFFTSTILMWKTLSEKVLWAVNAKVGLFVILIDGAECQKPAAVVEMFRFHTRSVVSHSF